MNQLSLLLLLLLLAFNKEVQSHFCDLKVWTCHCLQLAFWEFFCQRKIMKTQFTKISTFVPLGCDSCCGCQDKCVISTSGGWCPVALH